MFFFGWGVIDYADAVVYRWPHFYGTLSKVCQCTVRLECRLVQPTPASSTSLLFSDLFFYYPHRVIRQLRERLDNSLPVDLASVPVLAVGAILKDLLRSLPVGLFPVEMYQG